MTYEREDGMEEKGRRWGLTSVLGVSSWDLAHLTVSLQMREGVVAVVGCFVSVRLPVDCINAGSAQAIAAD